MTFATKKVPRNYDALAPDGSEVRILLRFDGGGMAQFSLPPGMVSQAVTHKTVEEIWYCISGVGEMWRRHGEIARTDSVEPGMCLTIPLGTHFQFRNSGREPPSFIGVTMPPWPGEDEAVPVAGTWPVVEIPATTHVHDLDDC